MQLGFVAAFYNLPIAIYAVYILLIDLIGNMLPLLMLSFDPAEADLMNKSPRKQGEMINKKSFVTILYSGIIKGGFWSDKINNCKKSRTNKNYSNTDRKEYNMKSIYLLVRWKKDNANPTTKPQW